MDWNSFWKCNFNYFTFYYFKFSSWFIFNFIH